MKLLPLSSSCQLHLSCLLLLPLFLDLRRVDSNATSTSYFILEADIEDGNEDEWNDWTRAYTELSDYTEEDKYEFSRSVNYEHKRYAQSCGRMILMAKDKRVKVVSAFHGEKQYPAGAQCDWGFIGTDQCTPQISCPFLDLRNGPENPNCEAEHLQITDGFNGLLTLCETSSAFTTPQKPARGKDLFVSFKAGKNRKFVRLFKGFRCEVSCLSSSRSNAFALTEKPGLLKEDSSCECGIQASVMEGRIVGGEDAKPFEFPWLVAIVYHGTREVDCGGSIINSQYILTAAHCFETGGKVLTSSTHELMVHFHNTTETDASEKSLRYSIIQINCHPNYQQGHNSNNDVCLLKLDRPVDIKVYRPICLPRINIDREQLVGTNLLVAGWGKLKSNGKPSETLQKVQVPVVSHENCANEYGKRYMKVTPSRMICAGIPQGGKDSCQGDSGGPILNKIPRTDTEKQWYQLGVVSWGKGCALPNLAGIYAYVPNFVPWIKRNAMDGTWCKSPH